MNITILAIGKKRSEYYEPAMNEYLQRIVRPFSIEAHIVDAANHEDGRICKERETTRLLERIQSRDYVIALDERGRDSTTQQLADTLTRLQNYSIAHVVFIIGGAYGFDDRVRDRANAILRLSSLTLPHELARLVLVEQLYRATNIIGGGKYHHE